MFFTFVRPDLFGPMRTFGRGIAVAPGSHLTEQRAVLLVKTSKEIILTARSRKELKWYLAPVEVEGTHGLALISAFFDDPDNRAGALLSQSRPLHCTGEPTFEGH